MIRFRPFARRGIKASLFGDPARKYASAPSLAFADTHHFHFTSPSPDFLSPWFVKRTKMGARGASPRRRVVHADIAAGGYKDATGAPRTKRYLLACGPAKRS
jgi:hypothetical protein